MKNILPIFIFTALIGTIATQVTSGVANLSGAAAVLLGLTTLFIVVAFIKSVTKQAR